MYYVYIVASQRNGTLYTGSTDSLIKRTSQHREKLRAGFTTKYGVDRLVWYEVHPSRREAFVRERHIKEWKRVWKLGLIERANPDWRDLFEDLFAADPPSQAGQNWVPAFAGMKLSLIETLTLTDFRSYSTGQLEPAGRSVVLFGPNGAGKTNLLEAISLFSPGKGLRGAAVAELGRRLPGEGEGRAWAVSALVGETRLGTGIEAPGAARRTVRVEGETVPPGRLAEYLRPVWLTPAQDRLFLEAASERRKFFDRLVFAAQPAHASAVNAYEKAMRERMRLLTDEAQTPDPAWLSALETQLGEAGARMVTARAHTLAALQAEIDQRGARPFPQARLSLTGEWEQMAAAGADEGEIAARLTPALTAARARDAAAGRAFTGPHRGDLAVIHAPKDRPAAECSTGEQKALILNLVLAQAARLSRAESSPSPILLLDEVAAHLDAKRREALAEELAALDLQAFLTGTDEALFSPFKGQALSIAVSEAGLEPKDT